MNSRTSSVSISHNHPPPRLHPSTSASVSGRRPSLSSRLSSVFSRRNSSVVEDPLPREQEQERRIVDEIDEIKRYEDFTTIDWVQDAKREAVRRKARRVRGRERWDGKGNAGWRERVVEAYEAAQGWIVVMIIGVAIGLNAAFLNIITEWLSDIKLGHCKTAFYLNENFCCWGEDNGCADWVRWSSFGPVNYVIYILFALLFAMTAAGLVKSFAPYAAGSGISEIKCIIAGFVMKGFLGLWTLIIKSIALPLAIASGLSVGKEGPSVHYAVCTSNVISRLFARYRSSASKTREILSAGAAAGVAVAFGSPIGGVLFSLEEMSSHFPLKTMWRSYFCALVATAVLAAMNPFRTGQLVMFQVHYDRSWHFFEVLFYVVIGIFGGLYGAFVIKGHLRVQAFRKKYLTKYAILEATLLATGTAIICYPNIFLRIDMTESMEILFLECEGAEDYHGLCEKGKRWSMVFSLTIATILRTFLVILSYGCKVPAGIFVPSMAIGASMGRTIGILVQALHEAFPKSAFFSACGPDGPCITPGTYAFLGAASTLSGIMHIYVSVVVIMFELTGALTYILPTMIVVGVTKAVSELFGKGGIADRMITFNGFPFLDNKEEHSFGVSVSEVMIADVVALPTNGVIMKNLETLLKEDRYQGFPIVEDLKTRVLIGYIGRTELRYAIDRVKRERAISPTAQCSFSPSSIPQSQHTLPTPLNEIPPSTSFNASSSAAVDFSRFIDPTPVTVHPRLALETVMELFRKIGPRVILVEQRGKLKGLVTVKDCLKYQFTVEAAERRDGANATGTEGERDSDEKVWSWLSFAASYVDDWIGVVSGGRIKLGGDGSGDVRQRERERRREGGIMNGDEDDVDDGVELDNR